MSQSSGIKTETEMSTMTTTMVDVSASIIVDILNGGGAISSNNDGDETAAASTTEPDNDSQGWTTATIILSIALFIISGLLEVGGGYMVWQGLRERRLPYILIPLGALVLFAYGIVPTFQPGNVTFGRVYAVYGGFFIVLSYAWSVVFDNFRLDKGDYIGASIALIGVCIAWFWPRGG